MIKALYFEKFLSPSFFISTYFPPVISDIYLAKNLALIDEYTILDKGSPAVC